jgi:hypothetical protein
LCTKASVLHGSGAITQRSVPKIGSVAIKSCRALVAKPFSGCEASTSDRAYSGEYPTVFIISVKVVTSRL